MESTSNTIEHKSKLQRLLKTIKSYNSGALTLLKPGEVPLFFRLLLTINIIVCSNS